MKKAFDRVEHKYLWNVFKSFGFPSGFINLIRMLYSDIEGIVKVNGGLSAPFGVNRGIRQGCSLSGMLYSIAIEPFLLKLRKALMGVTLYGEQKLYLSAYADDVMVAVTGKDDVEGMKMVVEGYGKLSSAKVNWSKCAAVEIGGWKEGKPCLPGGVKWVSGGIKYLGVFLGDEQHKKKNWEGVVEMIEGKLKRWKWLLPRMSYRGRTLIINNLVASTLWHRLASLEPPRGLLLKIQALMVEVPLW